MELSACHLTGEQSDRGRPLFPLLPKAHPAHERPAGLFRLSNAAMAVMRTTGLDTRPASNRAAH